MSVYQRNPGVRRSARIHQPMRAEELHGRGPAGHSKERGEALPSLLHAQEFQIIALEERDIEEDNGPEMEDGDRLPEPVGIDDQPDIVFNMPGPVERRHAVIERHEAQGAIDEAPEMLDKKRVRPTGERILERLPRSDRMEEAKQPKRDERWPVVSKERDRRFVRHGRASVVSAFFLRRLVGLDGPPQVVIGLAASRANALELR